MVLLMTVDPGFGGQSFINGMEKKIWELKNKIQKENPRVRLQVDGGINMENISDVVKAGADIIVAGSAIFESRNVKETIYKLRKKAEGI
jgi:ribulose-phosphate 3-epimerase